jgi:hypothetical protein
MLRVAVSRAKQAVKVLPQLSRGFASEAEGAKSGGVRFIFQLSHLSKIMKTFVVLLLQRRNPFHHNTHFENIPSLRPMQFTLGSHFLSLTAGLW